MDRRSSRRSSHVSLLSHRTLACLRSKEDCHAGFAHSTRERLPRSRQGEREEVQRGPRGEFVASSWPPQLTLPRPQAAEKAYQLIKGSTRDQALLDLHAGTSTSCICSPTSSSSVASCRSTSYASAPLPTHLPRSCHQFQGHRAGCVLSAAPDRRGSCSQRELNSLAGRPWAP
jgi:hypothetical protein